MQIMPIVYSTDPQASINFYKALGLETVRRSRNGIWFEFAARDAIFAVHGSTHNSGRAEMALVCQEPLEELVERLKTSGIEPLGDITDDEFGRSVRLPDPGLYT